MKKYKSQLIAVTGIIIAAASGICFYAQLIPRNVFACFIGFGAMLIASAITQIYLTKRMKRNREAYVNAVDERNVQIFEKAAAKTYVLSIYTTGIIALVFVLLNYNTGTLILAGLTFVNFAVYLFHVKYYKSRF